MKRRFGVYLVAILASTLLPAYSLKMVQKTVLHSYLRCFSGGVVLSLITLRILPRVYTHQSTFLAPFVSGVVFLALFSLEQLLSEDTDLLSNKRQYNAMLFCATTGLQSLRESLCVFRTAECTQRWSVLKLVVHKWLEGLALGCVVFDGMFSGFTEHLCIHLYALLAPIGAVLGAVFRKRDILCPQGSIEHLSTGALMGCLFYVGFIERIVIEFHRSTEALRPGLVVCTAAAGFVVASFVSYAVERLCRKCCEKTAGENAPCP